MADASSAPLTPAVPLFQPARAADLALLLAMVGELYRLEHIPFDEQAISAALGELLRQPAFGRVWLIVADAQPVGYLVLTFDYSLEYGGRAAFIDELFVRQSHRQRGIGTHAVQLAEQTCRELGIRALHLEVERANGRAQRLYRQQGFVDHDRYLMTKRLYG